MMKSTPSGVESEMKSRLHAFKERAASVKEAHHAARRRIVDDVSASDVGKRDRLADLDTLSRTKLGEIREEQESYVRGVRDRLERELRGTQPADASSVLLRRDAADRARRITDEVEALAVLSDAVQNGDVTMEDAIGHRGRHAGWVDVTEAYRAARPESADTAVALAFVEGLNTDRSYKLSNQMTYAAP